MLTLLLLAVQTAPSPPPPPDVVVVGERLKQLRFSARVDRQGRVVCRIRRSSGDPAIDALPCAAVRDCAARELADAAAREGCVRERIGARLLALTGKPAHFAR